MRRYRKRSHLSDYERKRNIEVGAAINQLDLEKLEKWEGEPGIENFKSGRGHSSLRLAINVALMPESLVIKENYETALIMLTTAMQMNHEKTIREEYKYAQSLVIAKYKIRYPVKGVPGKAYRMTVEKVDPKKHAQVLETMRTAGLFGL